VGDHPGLPGPTDKLGNRSDPEDGAPNAMRVLSFPSGVVESGIQTGTPRAPARWATTVSEVMNRSKRVHTAAVSMKGPVSMSCG